MKITVAERYLTIPEFAKKVGVTVDCVYKAIRSGRVKTDFFAGRYMILRDHPFKRRRTKEDYRIPEPDDTDPIVMVSEIARQTGRDRRVIQWYIRKEILPTFWVTRGNRRFRGVRANVARAFIAALGAEPKKPGKKKRYSRKRLKEETQCQVSDSDGKPEKVSSSDSPDNPTPLSP